AQVTATTLASAPLVILGQQTLTTAQATLFSDFVQNGGRLIALKPDAKLAGVLGLTAQGTTVTNGYLAINTASTPGTGLVSDTLQFKGPADQYAPAGATTLATFYTTATAASPYPAVTL